jgi:hypothetical protein
VILAVLVLGALTAAALFLGKSTPVPAAGGPPDAGADARPP